MHAEYHGKKEITLWFCVNKDVVKGKKGAHSPGGGGNPYINPMRIWKKLMRS